MPTRWQDIKKKHASPEVRARAAARTNQMLDALPLAEVRRARDFTQMTLAAAMGVAQSEVSKIERRTDVYLSTLRSYIEAMGGELEIVVRFPDGSVRVNQFEELGASEKVSWKDTASAMATGEDLREWSVLDTEGMDDIPWRQAPVQHVAEPAPDYPKRSRKKRS